MVIVGRHITERLNEIIHNKTRKDQLVEQNILVSREFICSEIRIIQDNSTSNIKPLFGDYLKIDIYLNISKRTGTFISDIVFNTDVSISYNDKKRKRSNSYHHILVDLEKVMFIDCINFTEDGVIDIINSNFTFTSLDELPF